MASLLRVTFPNPFGERPPTAAAIAALQKKHGFSDAYASLLRSQNGFRMHKLEAAKDRDAFMTPSPGASSSGDLAQLFTMAELPDAQRRVRALGKWFFAIGKGYGGDPYAEVLHGTYRGSVVHLNPENFLGASSFAEVAGNYDDFEDFDIDFNALSVDEQADFLVNEADLDLVARQAASIGEFVALCVHCDAEKFIGRCVAAPAAKGKTSKKAPVPAASKAKKKKADGPKAKKKPPAPKAMKEADAPSKKVDAKAEAKLDAAMEAIRWSRDKKEVTAGAATLMKLVSTMPYGGHGGGREKAEVLAVKRLSAAGAKSDAKRAWLSVANAWAEHGAVAGEQMWFELAEAHAAIGLVVPAPSRSKLLRAWATGRVANAFKARRGMSKATPPTKPDDAIDQAAIEVTLGRYDRARACLVCARKRWPDESDLVEFVILRDQGQGKAALDHLNGVAKKATGNRKYEHWETLLAALVTLGEQAPALAALCLSRWEKEDGAATSLYRGCTS